MNVDPDGITLKLVYDGPAQVGKSTNLLRLHARAAKDARGRLIVADGRTSSLMDLLPLHVQLPSGLVVRLRIYAAPAGELLASTRKLALAGADGVVFVASSAESARTQVGEGWRRLQQAMVEAGLDPETLPVVIQFNKRDAADARADEELGRLAGRGREPIVRARADAGEGVLATLFKLLRLVYRHLDATQKLGARLGGDMTEQRFVTEIAGAFGTLPPAE